jgi:hypothetical protein
MSFNKCAFKKNYLEKKIPVDELQEGKLIFLSDFLIILFLFVCFIYVPQQNEKAGLSDAHQNDIKAMLSKMIRSVTVTHHTDNNCSLHIIIKLCHFSEYQS